MSVVFQIGFQYEAPELHWAYFSPKMYVLITETMLNQSNKQII